MSIDEKVELCNVSKYIRKIPKYRYNGSYILKPGESVVIERDKINFFKPYAAIGIVVRNIVTQVEEVEKEVIPEKPVEDEKVVNTVEVVEEIKEEPVVEATEVTQEEIVIKEPEKEEVKEEIKEEIVKETPDLSKLEDMNLNQLKEMAKSIGIKEAASIRKKADIRDLIRKFYE